MQDALKELLERAESGEAQAQYTLGSRYSCGDGVKQNVVEAKKWFTLAAEQGHVKANWQLIFNNGRNPISPKQKEAIEELAVLAEGGDQISQVMLANLYHHGFGVEQDADKANYWYRKAAVRGSSTAMFYLGCLNMGNPFLKLQGYGDEAVKWFTLAAKAGDFEASFFLGMMHFAGQGVPESFAEAVQWWRTAADQGSPQAKIMLILTLGCKDDATLNRCEPDESAVRQYIEAAERGDANAQFRLGELYLQGRGITQDSQRAFKWLSTAGAQMHDFAGIFLGLLFNLGICLLQCEPKDAGWFKKEYEENEANSRFYDILRTCGLRGCAGYVEAFMWLNFGLEFGYHDAKKYCCLLEKEMSQEQIADAFYRLGYWLYEGCFVKTDHKKAYDSFLKSAKLGNVLGKNYVGACYENAIGVIKDYDKAFYWYTQAADEGNADALNQLSLMYEYGHGVPVDKTESQRLLEKAATLGSDFAIVRMKENQDANPSR